MACLDYQSKNKTSEKVILGSGSTSHLTAPSDKVRNSSPPNVAIRLADYSSITSNAKGTRIDSCKTFDGCQKIHLLNTHVVPDLATYLMSISSLVYKNIAVLFLPVNAVLIDLEDDNSIMFYETQEKNGLFFIFRNQMEVPTVSNEDETPYNRT